MSIKVMARVFDSTDIAAVPRLVLLALADHADDDGNCYPSVGRLARRTGLSERALQSNFKKLESAGLLRVDKNAGPRGCNRYCITLSTPAADAPPQDMHPRSRCTRIPPQDMRPAAGAPPQMVPNTPAAGAPEPSGNRHSSSSSAREAEVPDEDPFTPQPGDDPPSDVAADDQLYDQVVAAVGLTGGHLPTHWLPPAASIHVGRWRSQLGLTAAEIIATARESRKRHDEPPRGPKALDRAMQATAAAKSTSLSASGSARPRSPTQGQRKPHWQVMAERDESEQGRRHA